MHHCHVMVIGDILVIAGITPVIFMIMVLVVVAVLVVCTHLGGCIVISNMLGAVAHPHCKAVLLALLLVLLLIVVVVVDLCLWLPLCCHAVTSFAAASV